MFFRPPLAMSITIVPRQPVLPTHSLGGPVKVRPAEGHRVPPQASRISLKPQGEQGRAGGATSSKLSPHAAQADFELLIFPLPPPKFWDHKCVLLHLARYQDFDVLTSTGGLGTGCTSVGGALTYSVYGLGLDLKEEESHSSAWCQKKCQIKCVSTCVIYPERRVVLVAG